MSQPPRVGRKRLEDSRFNVTQIQRKGGGVRYVVQGYNRAGVRIREQMDSLERARARSNELDSQWIGRDVGAVLRLTRLSPRELSLAEGAFLRLSDPEDLKRAVDDYLRFGKTHKGAAALPSFEEALKGFSDWLYSKECDLREHSKVTLERTIERFQAACGPIALEELTSDRIDAVLKERWPENPTSRHNTRRCLSRFCSWCMLRPRRWMTSNPAAAKLIETKPSYAMSDAEPEIFTLREVMRMIAAARRFKDGKFLRFIVLSLFVGLRPKEAVRVRSDQPRLIEGELRLDAAQTKTGSSRTILLPDVAVAWLKVCPEGKTFDWKNNRLQWLEFKTMAKIKVWPHDGLRHTAISYYFRALGSYGLSAEWAGNSEDVIKKHYQGRVSTQESNIYWNLYPDRSMRARAMAALSPLAPQEPEPANVIRAFNPPSPKPNRTERKAR